MSYKAKDFSVGEQVRVLDPGPDGRTSGLQGEFGTVRGHLKITRPLLLRDRETFTGLGVVVEMNKLCLSQSGVKDYTFVIQPGILQKDLQ